MHHLYKVKSHTTKQQYDVCVICCARNGELYANESIFSVVGQKSCNFKLMLLDDASSDNTMNECLEILKNNNIDYEAYRSDVNIGVPVARNILASMCSCLYISIHDIDDIMMPFRLCVQCSFLNQNADIDCVGGHAYKIDSEGRFLDIMSYPPKNNVDIVDMLPGRVNPMIDPTTMMRLNSFRQMNGYSEHADVRLAQDFDLWIRMSRQRMKLANIQNALTQYRVSESSLTLSKKNEMIRAHVHVQSMHRSFLDNIRRKNVKSNK